MSESITVTKSTGNGLEYHDCPKNEYDIGDRISVNESIDLFINGQLCSQYVKYLEIVGINREFVIDEKEWYIHYEVSIFGLTTEIKRETLEPEDLEY